MDKLAILSVKSFYGDSPTGSTKRNFFQRRNKPENKDKNNSRCLLSDLQRYVKIFSERKVWKWFSRQQDALDFSLTVNGLPIQLFAFEKVDSKRRYLVTTLKQFWNRYKLMEEAERHYYEVIPIDSPSHLYFDIEYARKENPDLDGLMILETFIEYVSYCLFKQFHINSSRCNVVDLDSSTESKFSRHLVFHFDENLVFVNNVACGKFVKDICHSLKSFLSTGKSNEFLPVQISNENSEKNLFQHLNGKLSSLMVKSGESETFLCDLAVYSKNRNFRLYKSSKVTKKVPLIISDENKFIFKTKLTKKELKTYRNKGEYFDPDFLLFCDTLVCNNKSEYKTLLYGDDCNFKSLPYNRVDKYTENTHRNGIESSPFPELDAFVLHHCRENCKRGVINKWLYFKSTEVIIYDINYNRWCGNVNREHKSNKVYYVADLKVKNLYQKCHDPDCFYFRSSGIFIPDSINPMVKNDVDLSNEIELNELFCDEFEFDDLKTNVGISGNTSEPYHTPNEKSFDEDNRKLTSDDEMLKSLNINKSTPSINREHLEFDFCDEEFNYLFEDDFFVPEITDEEVRKDLNTSVDNSNASFWRNEHLDSWSPININISAKASEKTDFKDKGNEISPLNSSLDLFSPCMSPSLAATQKLQKISEVLDCNAGKDNQTSMSREGSISHNSLSELNILNELFSSENSISESSIL